MFQEMIWQIVNNVDIESANKIPLPERSPFIEKDKKPHSKKSEEPVKMIDELVKAANAPSPRVIKTHLPFEFLPQKLLDTCKVIFVGRNPKDVCVSFYHMHKDNPHNEFEGDFNDFANLFLLGATMYGSYWNMLKVSTKSKGYNSFLFNFLKSMFL